MKPWGLSQRVRPINKCMKFGRSGIINVVGEDSGKCTCIRSYAAVHTSQICNCNIYSIGYRRIGLCNIC